MLGALRGRHAFARQIPLLPGVLEQHPFRRPMNEVAFVEPGAFGVGIPRDHAEVGEHLADVPGLHRRQR